MSIEQDIAFYEVKSILKRSEARAAASNARLAKAKRLDDIAYAVLSVGLIALAVWAFPKAEASIANVDRVMQEASVKW